METVKVAREAMATRFEIVLHGENPVSLRAAGEEALDEIDWIEAQLSIYRSDSQINHANHRAASEPVKLEPTIFQLLQHCQALTQKTQGAFDITLGPLIRCWGFMGGSGHLPSKEAIRQARERVGFHHVALDPNDFTIRYDSEGVMLDLGSIGKGYALERAKEILEENGVRRALLHGGTSTVATIGTPPDQTAWKIAVTQPLEPMSPSEGETRQLKTVGIARLKGNALSMSAVWGKFFHTENRQYSHVINGQTGEPALGAVQATITLDSATDADALSTAMLVAGDRGIPWLESHFPENEYLLIKPGKKPLRKGFALPT
ncbi:MAG: FAD:protein FMN transferase [Verrucomicrobia subdivision 3 bacterium]|nr:FAD:protein FMN transferase [Limisphaerales bacterium]MCS1412876.1 FAD:protein FMN transferase [Limisphaerales bacterium]